MRKLKVITVKKALHTRSQYFSELTEAPHGNSNLPPGPNLSQLRGNNPGLEGNNPALTGNNPPLGGGNEPPFFPPGFPGADAGVQEHFQPFSVSFE